MAGIEVIIGANTDGLDEAVSRSRRSVNRLSDDFKKGIATAAKYSAAAIAAGAAIGVLAVSSIKAAKETVDLARVANSSVATFQKMSFAAKSVGVESEQLADILKDMSDRVGDFITTGGGPMADFFEKIAPQVGVTAEQFRKLSGPDALQLYVSSLEKANLSQSEMIFFMEAMASGASRLLPLMIDNGAAMALTAEQAEALGIALSEVDAQNITDAAKQIDAVGSVFDALSDQLAAEVSPLVSALGKQFLDLTEDAGGVDQAVSDLSETVDVATDVAAALAIVVAGRLTSALAVSGGALAFNAVQSVRVQLALGRMAGASTAAAAGMLALGGAARTASASMALLGGPVGIALIAAGSLYYFRDALFDTGKEVSKLQPELDDLTGSMNSWTEAQLRSNRANIVSDLTDARSAVEDLSSALDEAEEKESNAGRAQSFGASGLREELQGQVANVEALKGALGDLDEQLKLVTDRKDSSTASTAAAAATKIISGLQDEYLQLTLNEEQLLRHKLAVQGASESQIIFAVNVLKASRAIEEQRKQEDALSEMRRELDPAFAEFDRYADQIDQIEAFNISAGEKEALREESFRQHQERMNAIASEGQGAKLASEGQGQGAKLLEQEQADTLSSTAKFFGNLASIAQKGGEDQFKAYKALASAQAAISAVSAVVTTLGDPTVPSFLKIPLAVSIGALAAVQVAQIQAQTYDGARAMGGSVTGGSSYLVGEKGPEIVTMGGSGYVTPNNKIGGGISVTINDQTTTSTGHDVQTQETTGPEGQRQMQVTIRDTVRRQVMQGEFDRQLGSKFDLKSKGRRV